MTREQYDDLIAQARSLNLGPCAERWAWNRATTLGLHPELSDIPAPRMSDDQQRQSRHDWHNGTQISRSWLSRRA